MFSPLRAGVLRCFLCTYRWPRRGCKRQQCLYYWSRLWPWGGHSWPLEAPTIHAATVRENSDLASASHQRALRSTAKRDIIMYIPQSFPVQCCMSHLSACRGMRTQSCVPKHVLDKNEIVMIDKTTVEDKFYNQNNSYSSGQPQKESKDREEDQCLKIKEVSKGGDRSIALSENITTDINKTVNRSALGSEQLPSRVQRYFLWRYSWYLRKFQESLKNEMPDTFRMFHIFTVGLKEFMFDFKELIKILVYLSLPGSTLASLSRRELEVYYHMPRDMVRVFPVLLLSSLPFGQNVAFPIGYWFPRHLLCHHFWDIQQRHEFAVMGLQSRLFNARPVFRSLQAALLTLGEEDKEKCRTVFYKLGSGIHPTVEEIVALVPMFQAEPFHINKIGASHVNALLRLHGRSVWLWRRQRLKDHARILHCMDAAISREGIDSLTLDNLKTTLTFRGLNPTNMSTAAMMEYLQNWLKVSKEIDASSYSLLLHLPIFLAYNQPSNFALIYS